MSDCSLLIYSAFWISTKEVYLPFPLLHGWCHEKLVQSRRTFCVHNTAMHQFAITGGSCLKYNFCRDKIFLLRQTYFFRDKGFVATSILLSRQTCVCYNKTRLLSRQMYACRVKTKGYFCRDKRGVLSWQTCVCRDRHAFVKRYLW